MPQEYESGARLLLLNIAIGLGTFIQVLDTSIANVAIPYIAGNLSVSADEGTWVITSFAASNAIVLPLTGWLSDFFGRVRLYVWSVILFAIVSALCAASTSLTMLVVFRVIQGAVAGSLIPLSQSLMVASNPPESQGSALGLWGMIVVVAPVLGPIIGGYLTEEYSWPWIFYVNVPIGLFSGLVVWHFLKNQESKIVRYPIDWVGLFLLSVGVASCQIMLDKGKDLDWFESNIIIALTIVSVISLGYFILWSHRRPYPIVDFSFFMYPNFAFGTLLITVGYLVYFSSTVTVPLWLQTEQNYTAYWAGIAVAPVGLVPFLFSTTIGKHMSRVDLRVWSFISFLCFAGSLLYQATFTTSVDLRSVMLSRFLQGFGILTFFLPLVQLSLGNIPKERYASATGLFHFMRILIGSGFGTSLSIEIWTRLEIFHHARLSEAITDFNPQIVALYEKLSAYDPIFTRSVINKLVDQQVEQQAFMLATNDLAVLGAVLFLLAIPVLLLFRPIKPNAPSHAPIH